jgi:hypothetical protein
VSVHHLLLWGSRESNDSEVLQKIEGDVLGWGTMLCYLDLCYLLCYFYDFWIFIYVMDVLDGWGTW